MKPGVIPMCNFELIEKPLGDIVQHIIRHRNGAECRILTGHGGCLHGWKVLDAEGQHHELIEGYQSEAEILERFDSSHCGAPLVPYPNRTCSGHWSWEGKEYQFPCNFPWEQGHSIHGFLFDKEWTIDGFSIEKEGEEECAWLRLSYRYDGSLEGFPFPFLCRNHFGLYEDGRFEVRSSVLNLGAENLPFGEGWHPYFRLGPSVDECDLTGEDVLLRLEVDERSIPTGRKIRDDLLQNGDLKDRQLNHGYLIQNADREGFFELWFGHEESERDIRYWQKLGQNGYPYLQLYIPPHRQSLAIEPMTCPTNALNSQEGLWCLAPGEERWLSWGAEFQG